MLKNYLKFSNDLVEKHPYVSMDEIFVNAFSAVCFCKRLFIGKNMCLETIINRFLMNSLLQSN